MDGEGIPSTQGYGISRVCYAWIIIFKNDINLESPFSILPLSFFSDCDDFPWKFIEGEMTSSCRSEVRAFSKLPGEHYRIFAKIERGK